MISIPFSKHFVPLWVCICCSMLATQHNGGNPAASLIHSIVCSAPNLPLFFYISFIFVLCVGSELKTCCLKYLAIHKLLSTNIKRNSSVFGLVFPPFWISSSLTCFSQHEILSRHRRVALILDTWPDPRESIVQSSQWTTQILQCCPSSCRSLCPSVTQLVLISLQCHAERHDRGPTAKKASLRRIT